MNISDKAKSIVAAVAPTIATAIGGPFGALAGVLLSKVLGTPEKDDKAVEAAITSGNPELLLKLKEAEQNFTLEMEKIGIQKDQLVYTDIANARAREIALKDPTVGRLAWTIIGGFLVVSTAQIVGIMGWPEIMAKVPSQGWLLIGNISGYLANEAKQCAAYYFGSSLGSKDKDETIATIAKMP